MRFGKWSWSDEKQRERTTPGKQENNLIRMVEEVAFLLRSAFISEASR